MRTNADARESVNELIAAKYTSFRHDETDYPDLTGMKKKGALPKPKPTQASRALQEAGRRKVESRAVIDAPPATGAASADFKLSKFKNVPPRIGQTG